MTKVLSALLFSLAFALPAFAVDGYKELKFGQPIADIYSSGLCSFEETPSDIPGARQLICFDMQFAGQVREASAFFFDDQFMRLVIDVPWTATPTVATKLFEKYGEPSFKSPDAAFEAVEQLPNQSAQLGYDSDTVFLSVESDVNRGLFAVLVYTSPQYNQRIKDAVAGVIDNEL